MELVPLMKTDTLAVVNKKLPPGREKRLWRDIKANKHIYFFLLPGMLFLIIFAYVPMYGVILAFKTFMVVIWVSYDF